MRAVPDRAARGVARVTAPSLRMRVLAAAAALPAAGFSRSDLVVACWRADPCAFGLVGHEHPNAHAVLCKVWGAAGLLARGMLAQDDATGALSVTDAGREVASGARALAPPSGDPPAPDPSAPRPKRVKRACSNCTLPCVRPDGLCGRCAKSINRPVPPPRVYHGNAHTYVVRGFRGTLAELAEVLGVTRHGIYAAARRTEDRALPHPADLDALAYVAVAPDGRRVPIDARRDATGSWWAECEFRPGDPRRYTSPPCGVVDDAVQHAGARIAWHARGIVEVLREGEPTRAELLAELRALRAAAEAARDALIRARNSLERYGMHDHGCDQRAGEPCSCGLRAMSDVTTAAIDALPPAGGDGRG